MRFDRHNQTTNIEFDIPAAPVTYKSKSTLENIKLKKATTKHHTSTPETQTIGWTRVKATQTPYPSKIPTLNTSKSVTSTIISPKENSISNRHNTNSKSSQKIIPLRKPKIVSGFNVKKALQENPRDFHITAKPRPSHKGSNKDESKRKQIQSIIYNAKSKSNNIKEKYTRPQTDIQLRLAMIFI